MNAYSEFELGSVLVRPPERSIESQACNVTLEPLVMELLIALARRAGQLVTRREIFEICWGAAVVGDDSLNRIVAALRKALQRVGGGSVRIDTVAGAGYILRLAPEGSEKPAADASAVSSATQAAVDSWRLGLPQPDHLRIESLRKVCVSHSDNATAWGMMALLCRQAAEYANDDEVSKFVVDCETAARHALAIESEQPEALSAIATLAPLFGRWRDARERLISIIETHPGHPVPSHDLAFIEMAVGRVRAAKKIIDGLIAADPLAACYCYKSIYQHWSVGDLVGLDHVGDRAMQLWPTHPAVWTARIWTLAYTDRPQAALAMIEEKHARPALPAAFLAYFRQVITAFVAQTPDLVSGAIERSRELAAAGPAHAISSLFGLGLLRANSDAFEVAEAYYFHAGERPVPARHMPREPSITDQHRRVTQILFTPVFAAMRDDPRFGKICDRIGLTGFWSEVGVEADYLLEPLDFDSSASARH